MFGKRLPSWTKNSKLRWAVKLFFVANLLLVLIIWCSNLWVESYSKPYMYDSLDSLPTNDVALVLGTSRTTNGKWENLFFTYRITAAATLYHLKKVKHFIVSGDNPNPQYNEPRDMKKALKALGVPDSCITMDFAGKRTLDSVVRCYEIFGQKKFTIISQAFHNYRAVFIARKKGLDVVAFNAKYPETATLNAYYREWLARPKALLDLYLLGTQPSIMGEKIELRVKSEE